MNRPGYREAVRWIAYNDDVDLGNEDQGWIVSICLVADLWGKPAAEVAKSVENERKRL